MTLEEALQKLQEQEEKFKEYETELTSLKNFKETYEDKEKTYKEDIKKLKEANMNLFLKVTTEKKEDETPEGVNVGPKGEVGPKGPQENTKKSWDEFMQEF